MDRVCKCGHAKREHWGDEGQSYCQTCMAQERCTYFRPATPAAAEEVGAKKYLEWGYAGGPNECKHGYAAGIPCPRCDSEPPAQTEPEHTALPVTRYSPVAYRIRARSSSGDCCEARCEMNESPDGDYVEYSSYADLQAENVTLRGALRNMIREWCEIVGDETVNSTPADTLEKARAALAGKVHP